MSNYTSSLPVQFRCSIWNAGKNEAREGEKKREGGRGMDGGEGSREANEELLRPLDGGIHPMTPMEWKQGQLAHVSQFNSITDFTVKSFKKINYL